ncbi:hypothetical protein B0H13DRAFT_2150980, partial [Mycena leptocephala]
MHGASRSSSPVSQQLLGEIGSDDETAISSGPFQPCSDDGHSDDHESLPAEKFPLVESNTHWEDGVTSMIEYVTGAPSILPIFCTPTAIVIDLSDFWALDGVVRDIVSATVHQTIVSDFLTPGRTRAVVAVPGEPLIQCRRSGSTCCGAKKSKK